MADTKSFKAYMKYLITYNELVILYMKSIIFNNK